MTTDIVTIDLKVDANYSPDDGGWYLQRYGQDEAVSDDVYETKEQAIDAYQNGSVVWAK